ncbi:type IX secretion system plug protein domain-containing protein [Corallibacter sp.]|uniref:type IX secretion system plug protein n=1 Tax=Corallibacter sp. TaxID=2038084 RepID=UPI003AB8DE10
MSLSIRILFAVILIPLFNFSQEAEVNPPDYIKTIIFKGSNTQESQLPVLRLGEYISLEFDALNGEEDNYYYKIEHYNFDWTPSPLARAEFMIGFDNQRIRNYENSFNTFQIYSHYKLTIPNDRTRSLKVSGNYMLKVFNDYDELVFSRKFMVYENGASVGVNIKRSRNVKFIEGKQSVDIVVNATGIRFNNPLQNVKTVIIQNNNLNTAITDLKPQYTIGNELIYKYTNESSFWAGNEYLFFENKDIRAANTGIQSIELKDLYHNYLFTNTVRANKPYTYNPDINGNFLITAIDADNPDIEADYAWIHFSLLAPKMTDGKSIYVYGNFNNYALEDSNKMTYDDASGAYFTELLLKQGFYSYKYVVVDKNNNIDEGAIGGNFYQTENNYKVLVYYRELGARYDKLIGIGEASSVDISN